MTQSTIDVQAIPQVELNGQKGIFLSHLPSQQTDFEIDSTDDVFGLLYRVWGGQKGLNLLGTFYQNLDGAWISQSCNTIKRKSWATDTEAINAILAA